MRINPCRLLAIRKGLHFGARFPIFSTGVFPLSESGLRTVKKARKHSTCHISPHETADPNKFVTEVCSPVRRTSSLRTRRGVSFLNWQGKSRKNLADPVKYT